MFGRHVAYAQVSVRSLCEPIDLMTRYVTTDYRYSTTTTYSGHNTVTYPMHCATCIAKNTLRFHRATICSTCENGRSLLVLPLGGSGAEQISVLFSMPGEIHFPPCERR